MKKLWLKKKECTGCGACSNICPQNAIVMQKDNCGFIYPLIKKDCIDCNLCEKVCNSRGKVAENHMRKPITYAAWSQNSDVRYNSTSGGAFSEFAKVILERKGYVVGAQFRSDNLVEHVIVSDLEGLSKIRQSKYLQSEPGKIYQCVKEKLVEGKEVAFCGAPCQVAALYAYLQKDYDNLITLDFICRGMNSPKAFQSWLSEIEHTYGKRVSHVWFKYKDGGWNSSPLRTRLDFDDGQYAVKEGKDNLFMHGYLTSNLYIRPSCGNCNFKGIPRQSDITLADFWKVEKTLDDDKGTSMILLNSQKGQNLFIQAQKNLEFFKREFEEVYTGNICFSQSVKIPRKSTKFLKELDTNQFSNVLKKYSRVSFGKAFCRVIKKIIKKAIKR